MWEAIEERIAWTIEWSKPITSNRTAIHTIANRIVVMVSFVQNFEIIITIISN